MNKKILLTLAAAAMLGLAACGGNQPSSSSSAPASSSSASQTSTESSPVEDVFDGGIADLEVGVVASVDGIIANKTSKGFTLADGKAAVFVLGEAKGADGTTFKVGDYVHVECGKDNVVFYYGTLELKSPTITKKDGNRTLADIVTEATELTEAKVGEIFTAIKGHDAAGTVYSVEDQIPYKMTGVTAVANGEKGPAFKLGNSKLLCPHYYVAAYNRTEANRQNDIFEGVEYDVFFYIAGTNSTQNIDIHIYDVVAKFAAPESVSAAAVVELDRGEIISLTASVLPANANQGLKWSVVSGGDYIQLKQNRVKGIAAGEAVVRAAAAADETKYADIAITVSDPEVAYSTSLLTIDSFNTEGEYIGDEFVLSEIDGKSSASYGEFDFPKGKEASVSTVEATDGIFQVTIDVYGKYNNLKVYSGDEEVSGVKGDTWYGKVGSDYSYTYTLDYAKNIVIKNPGEYKVSVYAIEVRFIKGHEPEGGGEDPEPIENAKITLQYDGFEQLDPDSSSGYGKYNGDHVYGDYTVKTTDVMATKFAQDQFSVLQAKKASGKFQVTGEFQTVEAKIISTYDWTAGSIVVKAGDTALTIDDSGISSGRVDTGKVNTSGGKEYKIYSYTLVASLEEAANAAWEINTSGASGAVYFEYIKLA